MNNIIFKTLLLKGEAGNNIIDIKKTSTDGLVDTYTITRTDGVTTTFKVTNGKGITDIKKTGSTGLVDNYKINYNDGTSSTFSVTNGNGIKNIAKTSTSGLVDTYTITYNDGTTSIFTVTNGKDGKDSGVTVDNALSETSTNPVQNKVITNRINDVKGQIHTNLLNPTAKTQTDNGVTFTNNGDGTYTVNGTANNTTYYPLADQFTNLVLSREYKIVGCPQGGSENTYLLYDDKNSNSRDVGNGFVYTPTNQPKIYICILKGATVNNLLFKPMITTDLSATYDDFVPYTGDSGRLNEDVANFFDIVRPVGSLYPTTDASFNPNTAKGWHGKWERITDCVIYAAGTSDTIGAIVGSNTHTLTKEELPPHAHSIPALSGSTNSAGNHTHKSEWPQWRPDSFYSGSVSVFTYSGGTAISGSTSSAGDHTHSITTNASATGSQGSGTAIDMRTRRLNSVVWRRTA